LIIKNLKRFLKGSFTCIRCGKEFHAVIFGSGKIICPNCYHGEKDFISFDTKYWLNRIMAPKSKHPSDLLNGNNNK
jgi:hypothetical protein